MSLRHQHQPVLGRDAVPLTPRPNGVDRAAGQIDQNRRGNVADDIGVATHSRVMHYASADCKRLLHNKAHYARVMTDPAHRLRIARMRAGFTSAKEAAEAMGFPVSTYLAHENGSRGYPAKKAFTYARKFKVREQWLLYGVGPAPGEDGGREAEIVSIVHRLPPIKQAEALGFLKALAASDGE